MSVSEIVVTTHAVTQAVERRHYGDADLREVRRLIRRDVAAAIADGRISSSKPLWATLWSELPPHDQRAIELRGGKSFVWNEAESLGWIIVRNDGRAFVKTSLHRVRAEATAA